MIYLITIGSYSDYRVECYVDTEEEAIRVCSVLNEAENIYGDYYSYEECKKMIYLNKEAK